MDFMLMIPAIVMPSSSKHIMPHCYAPVILIYPRYDNHLLAAGTSSL